METAVIERPKKATTTKPPRKKRKPTFGDLMVQAFADGNWRTHEEMAQQMATDVKHIKLAIKGLKCRRVTPVTVERKKVGASMAVRMFSAGPREKMITRTELRTKLSPLVEGLMTEGKKDLATFSATTVRIYASRLKALLDDWTGE